MVTKVVPPSALQVGYGGQTWYPYHHYLSARMACVMPNWHRECQNDVGPILTAPIWHLMFHVERS